MTHNVHSEYCPCVSLLLISFFYILEMRLILTLLSFVLLISAGGPECGDTALIKPLCNQLNSTIQTFQDAPSKCVDSDNQGKLNILEFVKIISEKLFLKIFQWLV